MKRFAVVVVLIVGSGLGITAGAHRLWSHKAYKATWQLRLLLTFLFTISGQVSWRGRTLDSRTNALFASRIFYFFSCYGLFCPQRDAYTWAHDHRVHHKYSETDAGKCRLFPPSAFASFSSQSELNDKYPPTRRSASQILTMYGADSFLPMLAGFSWHRTRKWWPSVKLSTWATWKPIRS